MTTVCLCIVAFVAVVFFAYIMHMFVLSRLDALERKMVEINPARINPYNGKSQTIGERIKKLEDDVEELNQFYYISSDSDDKSLVDMVKELEEQSDKLYLMISDCINDINDLRVRRGIFKSSYPRQTGYKITVGDDPNQMQNGTTVSTAETIPHFTQYRRTIPYEEENEQTND